MNGRTAKLIGKIMADRRMKRREKRRWQTLTSRQRAKDRRDLTALAKAPPAESET